MWILKGIFAGFVHGTIAIFVLLIISCLITGLYNKIKTGCFACCTDECIGVAFIGAAIVAAYCIGAGIWAQCSDKWVDFYDNKGNIVETYQITSYDESWFGDGITFYLKDGRTIIRKECVYNVRVGDESK